MDYTVMGTAGLVAMLLIGFSKQINTYLSVKLMRLAIEEVDQIGKEKKDINDILLRHTEKILEDKINSKGK